MNKPIIVLCVMSRYRLISVLFILLVSLVLHGRCSHSRGGLGYEETAQSLKACTAVEKDAEQFIELLVDMLPTLYQETNLTFDSIEYTLAELGAPNKEITDFRFVVDVALYEARWRVDEVIMLLQEVAELARQTSELLRDAAEHVKVPDELKDRTKQMIEVVRVAYTKRRMHAQDLYGIVTETYEYLMALLRELKGGVDQADDLDAVLLDYLKVLREQKLLTKNVQSKLLTSRKHCTRGVLTVIRYGSQT